MTLLVANTPKELQRLQKNTKDYVEPITAITIPYLGEHKKEHYDLIVFSKSVINSKLIIKKNVEIHPHFSILYT